MATGGVYVFLESMVKKYPSKIIPKNTFITEICVHYDIICKSAIKNKFDFMLRQGLIEAGKQGWIIKYNTKKTTELIRNEI